MPADPVEALKWATAHYGDIWWVFGGIIAALAWTSKRLRDWNRRNALPIGPTPPKAPVARAAPGPAKTASYTAAPSYAASTYTAQPAYAAPPAAPANAALGRKVHPAGASAQRAAAPAARSVDVPVPVTSGRWTLAGAFGDPAHARTAVVIAEVLGPPVGLR